jgi:antitoxin component YwqK of YwqJK toxin-antitoxin module
MKTKTLLAVLLLVIPSFLRADDAGAADYKKLGFADGKITNEGKPYTGVAIKRDKQGNKRARYVYKDGLLEGVIEEWYADGVKSVECTFMNNQRHGTNTYWKTDGSLLKRQVWKAGKLVESTDPHDLETPAP